MSYMKTPSVETKCYSDAFMKQALAALTGAKLLKSQGIYNSSCFHAHQAAEYSIKALVLKVLGRLDKTHKTHELPSLLNSLASKVQVPEEIKVAAEKLSPHYEASRYPEITGEFFRCMRYEVARDVYTSNLAADCIKDAEMILNWVKEKLQEFRE